MDWAKAIERNSEALKGVIAGLFVMLGFSGVGSVGRIAPALYRAALRLLQPAESALRRLIIIAARGLVVKPRPSRPKPAGPLPKGGSAGSSFQLFDSRKKFEDPNRRKRTRTPPRIHVFGGDPRVAVLWQAPPAAAPAPPADGLVDATHLGRRLAALKAALENLPRQARRLARWRLRREKAESPKFRSPLRPGHPPGHRRKPVHEIDYVLAECHGLAHDALKPDTS